MSSCRTLTLGTEPYKVLFSDVRIKNCRFLMVERECDVKPMNGFRIVAFCRGADSVERALLFGVGFVGGGGGSEAAFDCTVIRNDLIARHHTDNALRTAVHPFLVRNGPAFRFQQYHVAMIMLNILNAKGVNV